MEFDSRIMDSSMTHQNKPKNLSIITVVKSDPDGLLATAQSIAAKVSKKKIEWIVWINSESSNLAEHLRVAKEFGANRCVVGDDHGIFDAMNKALCEASGKYVLFLNARDTIEEPFEIDKIDGPKLIPVTYINYFGVRKFVRVSISTRLGMPYCHQGIILPRIGYHFNANLKYGADYLALLDFGFSWPLPKLGEGLIMYDTTGVSTVNRWESDKSTASVINKKYGIAWAVIYLSHCLIKLFIKRIYDFKQKLIGKKSD